jgi:hypothetical protein
MARLNPTPRKETITMSLDSYADSRRRISQIQSRLDETIESLRANTSLSDQGRRAEMAKATLDARKMVERVKTEVVTARTQRRNELTRYLFGLSPEEGGILTMRDARDRAAKLDGPEAAGAALRQAQLAGDRSLVKAITHVAVDHGWQSVIDDYVAALGPEEVTPIALSLQSLAAIPSGRNTDTADAAVFRVRPPNELFGSRDEEIAWLARDAAPEAQQLMPTTTMHTTTW